MGMGGERDRSVGFSSWGCSLATYEANMGLQVKTPSFHSPRGYPGHYVTNTEKVPPLRDMPPHRVAPAALPWRLTYGTSSL